MSYRSSRNSARSLGILVSVLTIVWLLLQIFRALKGRMKSEPGQAITKTLKGTKYEALTPYIIAQAKHETGGFNPKLSKAFELNNNLFGMQRPQHRNTTDTRKGDLIVEGKLMAHYPNYESSTEDYILWLDQFKNPPFPTQIGSTWHFAKALHDRRYFTDSIQNYSRAIAGWL